MSMCSNISYAPWPKPLLITSGTYLWFLNCYDGYSKDEKGEYFEIKMANKCKLIHN